MKSLQKNVLWGVLLLFSLSTTAQRNQIPIPVSSCYSAYSTTLLLENQIAIEPNTGLATAAAPLFIVGIENRWGTAVSVSQLNYSFKITNYNEGQPIDFENFDYLNDNYITDDFAIIQNGDWYEVTYTYNQNAAYSPFLIDDRSSLIVENVLERSIAFYRGDEDFTNEIGFTIELKNISFKTSNYMFFDYCAANYTETVLIELEDYQKYIPSESAFSSKIVADNLMYSFPNPAKDIVYIHLGSLQNNAKNYDVQIYTINGQIVLSEKWIAQKAINVAQLSEGIYNISVFNQLKQIQYSNKLIIE